MKDLKKDKLAVEALKDVGEVLLSAVFLKRGGGCLTSTRL